MGRGGRCYRRRMGANISAGVVGMMALDDDGNEADATAAEAWLRAFAALGISRRFREVIGDRVAELTYDDGKVGLRWLGADEAAPILAQDTYFGSASNSAFPSCLDSDLYVPNCRSEDADTAEVQDAPFEEFGYEPIETAIAALTDRLAGAEGGGDTDLMSHVLERLRFCATHQMILVLV